MQELPNPDAESENSVNEEEPTIRLCGCPLDYHLSDCSITHPPSLDFEDLPIFYEVPNEN